MKVQNTLAKLIRRYPSLEVCENAIKQASTIIIECYQNEGKLLICGNGGSASDADHIVGELMKSFSKKRPINEDFAQKLAAISNERGPLLAEKLEGGLPAISLNAHSALVSAISNDIGGGYIFAQQVMGYGLKNDVLIAISTSGNSQNVIEACITARAKNMKVIGLLGQTGGEIRGLCDVPICVPSTSTAEVQEYHLPIYHVLCTMAEETFF